MWFLSKFVDQKNKKAWEAQSSINVNALKTLDRFALEIDVLSNKIDVLEEALKAKPIFTGEVTLIGMSTTNAIIDTLLKENGKKLHYSDIYSRLKYYNLTNKNVTPQSVKAILYQLARQKRIVLDNGTETGMFFIKK